MGKRILTSLIGSLISLCCVLSTCITASADEIKYSTADRDIVAKGVDISYWQGDISFDFLADNFDYAILRAGYGIATEDVKFDTYVAEAQEHDLDIGAYWFSYATTPEEAEQEAYKCLEVLADTTLQYPVYFDIESENVINMSSDEISEIVYTFCDIVESHGYYVGVYTYAWLANSKFNESLDRFDLWLADINHDEVSYRYPVGMWQNSVGITIDGEYYYLDVDYSYKNYPSIMKKFGLNNN